MQQSGRAGQPESSPKTLLIVGGCSDCRSTALITLRQAGLQYEKDYHVVGHVNYRQHTIFERHRDWYHASTVVLFNPNNGKFINMKPKDDNGNPKSLELTDVSLAAILEVIGEPASPIVV